MTVPPDVAPPVPAIKFCGLMRNEDALEAERLGAAFVGLILAGGFGRTVSLSGAQAVLAGVERARAVTVRVDDPLERVIADAQALGAGVIQLHGSESPAFAEAVRGAGDWNVWKAVRVQRPRDVLDAIDAFGTAVDGLLLDGWHPERPGGTGRAFSWDEVAGVRNRVPDGVVLIAAGGLDPGNVAAAVRRLRPEVVDVSSGVEDAPGRKSHPQMRAFVRAVRDTEVQTPRGAQ